MDGSWGPPSDLGIQTMLGSVDFVRPPVHLLRYLVTVASSCLSTQDKGNSWMVRSQFNLGQIPKLEIFGFCFLVSGSHQQP